MATKTFDFTADVEDWAPTEGGANTSATHNNSDGCLQMHYVGSGAAEESYWEWQGTWEDLGVPAGEIVTHVTADYDWRCTIAIPSDAVSRTGPLELRDAAGNLQATLSAGQNFSGSSSWDMVEGSEIAVPSGVRTSGSTIRLRLRCRLSTSGGSATFDDATLLQQDNVVLEITSTTSPVTQVSLSIGMNLADLVHGGALLESSLSIGHELGASQGGGRMSEGTVTFTVSPSAATGNTIAAGAAASISTSLAATQAAAAQVQASLSAALATAFATTGGNLVDVAIAVDVAGGAGAAGGLREEAAIALALQPALALLGGALVTAGITVHQVHRVRDDGAIELFTSAGYLVLSIGPSGHLIVRGRNH